ncbi:MAG: hypothetical protein H6823_26745, partial [Planctomycetaceae bacterium]|nr:hypothetical protein [Planctomycetaceae bacterium]
QPLKWFAIEAELQDGLVVLYEPRLEMPVLERVAYRSLEAFRTSKLGKQDNTTPPINPWRR